MNIKKSLYFRMRNFVEIENLKLAAEENNFDYNSFKDIPIELIETMETIKNYKHNANVLLDVGSHKGLFSKIANAFFNFEKTICFEPNRDLHNTIKLSNSTNSNLIIEELALSTQEGQTTFYLHQDNSMNSIVESKDDLLKKEFPWDNPKFMTKATVNTTTLDTYIASKSLQNKMFLLKIDTQGNELNILKKGLCTLEQTELCVIEYMFTTPYKTDFSFFDLISFMKKNKFECKGPLSINKRPSKKISAVDFLFVKEG